MPNPSQQSATEKVILVTDGSSGVGALTVNALAQSGHTGSCAPTGASMSLLAARTALDALAVQYARELTRWGIETSIIVAGEFGRGFASCGPAVSCADSARAAAYQAGANASLGAQVQQAFADLVPKDANAGAVAGAIAGVVDTLFGERPFHVHVDPCHDGADIVFGVMDRVREEMLHRVGLADLLKPRDRL